MILAAFLSGILPTYIDFVLLLRLHAVFPPHVIGRRWYIIIMGVPIVINLGRLANTLIYTVAYSRNTYGLSYNSESGVAGAGILPKLHLPSATIEWALQIVADV